MNPQPGQIWADNDKRSVGRTLRVDNVDSRYANCSVLTVAGGRSAETIGKHPNKTKRYPTTRILLERFTANSTGYVIVPAAVPAPEDEAVAAEITEPDGVREPVTPARVWDTGAQEPSDCDRVTDVENDVWVRVEPHSWHLIGDPADGAASSWESVLEYGPLTEARHG